MTTPTFPVHVDAHLDPHLSRWLWLVKWLLAIPHYVVLVFLWLAFAVLSVVAFFAILFTGRYPRALRLQRRRAALELAGGLLRLRRPGHRPLPAVHPRASSPDYPAHLEVDYPEHLSRGLVLVKWWLLAIPHYLVVGAASSAAPATASPTAPATTTCGCERRPDRPAVLFAAVALLFTGRYPQPLFDLVLGLNRWVLRVAAYAAPDDRPLPAVPAGPGRRPTRARRTRPGRRAAPSRRRHGSCVRRRPAPERATPWTAGRVVSLVRRQPAPGRVGSALGLGGAARSRSPTRSMRDDDGS